jgi:hypothetical protein
MNLKENFEQLNILGKAGALTMAAGALCLVSTFGVWEGENMHVNGSEQPVLDIPSNVDVVLPLSGVGLILAGQGLLNAGYKKRNRLQ